MKNVVLTLCLALASAVAASAPTKQQCLACHGSFESIIARNVKVEADPEPVNPHVYIPHTEKGDSAVWDCNMCHTAHEIPPKPGAKAEANIDACYQCHHNYVLKKCSSCHDGK